MASTISGIIDFTRSMWGDLLTRMSGPLSVPLAVASFFVPNDVAKILLGLTAFMCLWVTAYLLWKREHDKVVERDQRKRQLLDEISALREKMVRYRIKMEADHAASAFNQALWQQKFDALENEIDTKIEQLSSRAEAITYRNRGNIPRATRPNPPGAFICKRPSDRTALTA